VSNVYLNIHATLPQSASNGPGLRYVVWLQGCTFKCPGCFNPDSQNSDIRRLKSVLEVFRDIKSHAAGVEGLTVSGGEPFQQAAGLLELLTMVRAHTDLSILVFSGYEIDQIRSLSHGPEVLELIDVLIDGPYVRDLRLPRGLRGSTNQKVHFLTNRYHLQDVDKTPPAEIVIDPEGNIISSGIDPWTLYF